MAAPSMASCHEDHSFTNDHGEVFHYSIFPPSVPSASSSSSTLQCHEKAPVLLCVHGAGMSGDCFFRLAQQLQVHPPKLNAKRVRRPPGLPIPPMPESAYVSMVALEEAKAEDIEIFIVTYDQRCHGGSTNAGGEDHLTIEVLMDDFAHFLQHLRTTRFPENHVYIVGHSLGGAIVARALQRDKALQASVAGVVLVDIVEGTAVLSLKHMRTFLQKRPHSFHSIDDAESWFLQHGGMRSVEGAAVSAPPLLRLNKETGEYVWRTNIEKMEAVWDGWFPGLDAAFVSLQCSKVLCMSTLERLDKDLTVAQMQGKFQLEIMGNNCGHYVMDDATMTMVAMLRRFIRRNEELNERLSVVNEKMKATHMNTSTVPPSQMHHS